MINPYEYATYRGREGQWAWILHRLTGVGVFIFLLAHIIDTACIGWGQSVYNKMIALYRNPYFRVGEVLLAGAVLYHALNGIRIIIIDFWPEATVIHRKLFYAVVVFFGLLYIPAALYMLEWLFK